jgi:putative ubiquitin-RnfH superfamily antitoxin RatB of RatAB toxin-antitoxin module
VNIPYDNGKVKIGIYYQKPKYIEEDSDMLRLQSYLIGDPKMLKKQYWYKVAYNVLIVFVLLVIVLSHK